MRKKAVTLLLIAAMVVGSSLTVMAEGGEPETPIVEAEGEDDQNGDGIVNPETNEEVSGTTAENKEVPDTAGDGLDNEPVALEEAVSPQISGAEALERFNAGEAYILDVRALDVRNANGHIKGSLYCPQFPLDDLSLDNKMQIYAQRFKEDTKPIYILCNSGSRGAERATRNLIAAGISADRAVTITGGATDEAIKAAFTTDRHEDYAEWQYIDAAKAIEAANDTNSKIHMLDTRKASLYAAGHLRRSVSVPVVDEAGNFQAEMLDKLAEYAQKNYMNDNEPIYILCNSGNKLAKTAISLMVDAGIDFSRLYIIRGGAADEQIQANFVTTDSDTPADGNGTNNDQNNGEGTQTPNNGQGNQTANTSANANTTRTTSPRTGDTAPIALWITIMGIAVIAMFGVRKKRLG